MSTINVESGTDQNAGKLESVIDSCGLAATIDALAQICYAKAEHLRVNWQDNVAANAWSREAAKLLKLAVKVQV